MIRSIQGSNETGEDAPGATDATEINIVVDAYMAKHNKELLQFLGRMKTGGRSRGKKKQALNMQQKDLLDSIRTGVGLGCVQQLFVVTVFAMGVMLLSLVALLWVRGVQLQFEVPFPPTLSPAAPHCYPAPPPPHQPACAQLTRPRALPCRPVARSKPCSHPTR